MKSLPENKIRLLVDFDRKTEYAKMCELIRHGDRQPLFHAWLMMLVNAISKDLSVYADAMISTFREGKDSKDEWTINIDKVKEALEK